MDAKKTGSWALLALVGLSLGAFIYQKVAGSGMAAIQNPAQTGVQALYLHGNFRCETCNAIEAQAEAALRGAFAKEMGEGALSWASVNMDKEPNGHYGDDFKLSSASLVLTDGKGPGGKWAVLERTWDLVKDSLAFRDYVVKETRLFLAGAH
jgi:hypothetical protein